MPLEWPNIERPDDQCAYGKSMRQKCDVRVFVGHPYVHLQCNRGGWLHKWSALCVYVRASLLCICVPRLLEQRVCCHATIWISSIKRIIVVVLRKYTRANKPAIQPSVMRQYITQTGNVCMAYIVYVCVHLQIESCVCVCWIACLCCRRRCCC